MLTALPSLDELARDPERARDLPAPVVRAILGQLAAIQLQLVVRLAEAPGEVQNPDAADRLLTATRVAERLGRSPKWVYANAARLPFAIRLDGQHPRFSERGLERWITENAAGSSAG